MLATLMTDTLETFANHLDTNAAQAAFEKQFPRLIMPPTSVRPEPCSTDHDVVRDAWVRDLPTLS